MTTASPSHLEGAATPGARNAGVQALRATAAALVVVDHGLQRSATWWSSAPARVDAYGSNLGVMGVYVFFVISGFIMIHSSHRNYARPSAALEFFIRRVIRIVPMYWLATLLETSLRTLRGSMPTSQSLLHSLFFIPEPPAPNAGQWMRPVLGSGWTLNYELFFYLLFAGTMFLSARRGITVLLLGLVSVVGLGAVVKPLTDTAEPVTRFTYWTDPVLLLFAAGCLLGLLHRSKWASLVPRLGVWTAIVLLIVVSCFVALGPDLYPPSIEWRLVAMLLAVACAVGGIFAKPPTGEHPFLRALGTLGDASYSTYLVHFVVIVAMQKVWVSVVGPTSTTAFLAAALAATNLVGLLLHFVLEAPINVALLRAWRRRASRALKTREAV
jgi:exopolysaccharide production protein ExoZ